MSFFGGGVVARRKLLTRGGGGAWDVCERCGSIVCVCVFSVNGLCTYA